MNMQQEELYAYNQLDGLPDVSLITRYCNLDEIRSVMQHLSDTVALDHQRIFEWKSNNQSLIASIDSSTRQELKEIHDKLNHIEMERFLLVSSVSALHQSCTEYRDLLAKRVMLLVADEMDISGYALPDIPFALLSMGSDGREEQTLITDQDYLIVYGDGGGEAADSYFLKYSELLVEYLEDAGFKRCTGGIMPINQEWRGSMSQWRRRLLSIVRYESEDLGKNMMDLIVLSDARYVGGDRQLADSLATLIRDMEHEFFQVLWGMAKAATEMRLALGFLKRIWTESGGEHKGEFNLKLLAWAPLVMNVRIISINQGLAVTNTVERINRLEKEGSFSSNIASGLKDAYQILTKYRILLQIKVIKGIQNDSHHLNPYQLPTEEREKIRKAMLTIEDLQKTIHNNFQIQ